VRSAVVVDEPVMSPKLRNLGEPVFDITELSGASDLGLDALCTVVFTPFPVADEAGKPLSYRSAEWVVEG
jgi:hypothetical protein